MSALARTRDWLTAEARKRRVTAGVPGKERPEGFLLPSAWPARPLEQPRELDAGAFECPDERSDGGNPHGWRPVL